MSDTPDNIILSHLRAIRGDLATLADRFDDFGRRLTALEGEVRLGLSAARSTGGAREQTNLANVSLRLDGFERRMARIERRLDIVDA